MEIPQIDPIPDCPQNCQRLFADFNSSLRRAGEAVATSEDPDNAIQRAVALRSEMRRQGQHYPVVDGVIDEIVATDQYAYANIVNEVARAKQSIDAINAMAACAIGGCKAMRAGPLLDY